jgi:AraC-like DNA-binding protein
MSDVTPEPLHRFPVFRTSNSEELRQLCTKWLGATRVDLRNIDDFDARVNRIEFQETSLAFGAINCDVTADLLATDFIRLQMAMKGHATTTVAGRTTGINEWQFAITPAGIPSQTLCLAGHQRLTLRLKHEALSRKLSALFGLRPKGALRFGSAIAVKNPYARSLRRLIDFLSREVDATTSVVPVAVYRELEQAIQLAFLSASCHSFNHLLETPHKLPDAGVVSRLEDFIEAHWREAITIERLVTEAGVSGRSLFRTFERARGYSPMAFVKAVRLRNARQMLQSGDPGVSVASAASACNFANQGHFARHYREAFGELPSATLAMAAR